MKNPGIKNLDKFLDRIGKEIPEKLFNDPSVPRASKQSLGVKKAEREAMVTTMMERSMIKKNIATDKQLVEIARNVIKSGDSTKVHDKVIQRAIREKDNVVEVEMPIWKADNTMTGHVDIVSVEGGKDSPHRITIADFKTEDEDKFVKYIPQVTSYAKMLESQLGREQARIICGRSSSLNRDGWIEVRQGKLRIDLVDVAELWQDVKIYEVNLNGKLAKVVRHLARQV